MKIAVDVWLRGTDFATTATIEGPAGAPAAWSDSDVRTVLEGMLRALDRQKNPGAEEPPISLRGLSWIVNPYEDGGHSGVVIAIEISLGAAIAGPFDVDKSVLDTMIARVLATPAASAPSTGAVH